MCHWFRDITLSIQLLKTTFSESRNILKTVKLIDRYLQFKTMPFLTFLIAWFLPCRLIAVPSTLNFSTTLPPWTESCKWIRAGVRNCSLVLLFHMDWTRNLLQWWWLSHRTSVGTWMKIRMFYSRKEMVAGKFYLRHCKEHVLIELTMKYFQSKKDKGWRLLVHPQLLRSVFSDHEVYTFLNY